MTAHLQHLDTEPGEVSRQPGTVGAGAFDPYPVDLTMADHPCAQLPIALRVVGERLRAEYSAGLINERSNVRVFVGIDSADHSTSRLCHRGHCQGLPPVWLTVGVDSFSCCLGGVGE